MTSRRTVGIYARVKTVGWAYDWFEPRDDILQKWGVGVVHELDDLEFSSEDFRWRGETTEGHIILGHGCSHLSGGDWELVDKDGNIIRDYIQ